MVLKCGEHVPIPPSPGDPVHFHKTAAVAGGRSALHLDLRLSFCGVHLGHLGETNVVPKNPIENGHCSIKKNAIEGYVYPIFRHSQLIIVE